MRLLQDHSHRTWKMDRRIYQEACRLPFPRPAHQVSSSNGGSTNEPSAEILDRRGRARSQEVRQRVLTTDKGSPHLEGHRRLGDGSDAPRNGDILPTNNRLKHASVTDFILASARP